ncbi:pentapeptide repeat-containing protein [Butyrivibrio sp. YAB3001]|uniref:pentapeptide repeat-containing protein n=1 Tax=Butyrivibrio sp. YAB3001 TaxID=1520812 RepID=UPI000B89118D|nr:pentapeptide repeat-containing protein [Butyrivibrio sp. YAB3001]
MKGIGDDMQISMGMSVLTQKKIEKAEFDKRMEEHTKWLKNNEEGKRADFSDVDLSEMDLSGMDFSYADMMGVNLRSSNLAGANLSNANLWGAHMHNADLTGAVIDGTTFYNVNLTLSKLNECKGKKACFSFSCMWDCEIKNAVLKKANFFAAEICDCDFSGSDLEEARFCCADFDDSTFVDTRLCNANFDFARRTYWTDFTNSDMTGLSTAEINLNPDNLKGVKGLHMPIFCPEEGSFIAWKKCREGKIVKLLIPEHAKRKGSTLHSCRASEAVVLDIFDKEGNSVDEAVSRVDKEFKYIKGTNVIAKELDPKRHGDVSGIYFELSRREAEALADKDEDEEDNN